MGTRSCAIKAQAALSHQTWVLERWSPLAAVACSSQSPACSLRLGTMPMRSDGKPTPVHLPMQPVSSICEAGLWLLPPNSCVKQMSPGTSVAVWVPQQQALMAGQHVGVVVLHHAAHTRKQNLTFQVELRILQEERKQA